MQEPIELDTKTLDPSNGATQEQLLDNIITIANQNVIDSTASVERIRNELMDIEAQLELQYTHYDLIVKTQLQLIALASKAQSAETVARANVTRIAEFELHSDRLDAMSQLFIKIAEAESKAALNYFTWADLEGKQANFTKTLIDILKEYAQACTNRAQIEDKIVEHERKIAHTTTKVLRLTRENIISNPAISDFQTAVFERRVITQQKQNVEEVYLYYCDMLKTVREEIVAIESKEMTLRKELGLIESEKTQAKNEIFAIETAIFNSSEEKLPDSTIVSPISIFVTSPSGEEMPLPTLTAR